MSDELPAIKPWQEVEGYFDYPHVYNQAVDEAENGSTIVEIGSWLGQSMSYLAQNLMAKGWSGRLVSVDTFKGEDNQVAHKAVIEAHKGDIRPQFEQNLRDCGVHHMVEIVQSDSAAAAEQFQDGECSFVFIDAAHDYLSVQRDVLAWVPKMKPGGLMAGHDYPCPDVHRAVCECFAGTGYTVAGSCWVKRFPLNMTPADWREAITRGAEIIAHAKQQ